MASTTHRILIGEDLVRGSRCCHRTPELPLGSASKLLFLRVIATIFALTRPTLTAASSS